MTDYARAAEAPSIEIGRRAGEAVLPLP